MWNVDDCVIIDLPQVHSASGSLTALENRKNIPFDIKRIYYLYDVPHNSIRGGHAHYELQQFVIAASGSFTFILDDGSKTREVFLNTPLKALFIKPGIWREMKNFSSGSVCLVMASLMYDESDYMRNYGDFLKYRENNI
jgi:dTDP-4-dehydrorhamnose 3,5-epimerase-like enzyme